MIGPPTLTHLLARERSTTASTSDSGAQNDLVLCVHNLARSAQAVELDLSLHRGRYPVELFGRSRFPKIGDLSYLLTLAPRGFYWFQLVEEGEEAI